MKTKNYLFAGILIASALLSIPLQASAQMRQKPSNEEIANIEARYKNGERSLTFMRDYARAMQLKPCKTMAEFKNKGAEIENTMQDYFSTLTDQQRTSSDGMFIYREYTSTTPQPAMQWMVANKGKFPADMQSAVDSIIAKTYDSDVHGYFSGRKTYDATAFKTLQNEIKSLGLNKDGKYDVLYGFVNAKGKGNINNYMKYCEKNAQNLTKEQQMEVFGNFASMVDRKDLIQRVNTSKFLRRLLPALDIDVVYQTISQIVELEKTDDDDFK